MVNIHGLVNIPGGKKRDKYCNNYGHPGKYFGVPRGFPCQPDFLIINKFKIRVKVNGVSVRIIRKISLASSLCFFYHQKKRFPVCVTLRNITEGKILVSVF